MKRVLIIVPFDNVYPPMNGGMLRCINLLHQLTKYFEVTAVIHQDKNSFLRAVTEYPSLKALSINSTRDSAPTKDIFSLLPAKIAKAIRYRLWNRSLKGPTEDNFLRMYPVVKKLISKQSFDFVILEELANLNLVKLIRSYQPGVRIIYDAYNVNTRLYEAAVEEGKASRRELELTQHLESNLSGLVNCVFTCSELDLVQLKEMNKGQLQGVVIPNGVGINGEPVNRSSLSETNEILFCGSLDYLPNQQGLLWFCRDILPLLLQQKPSVRLMVVGKGDPGNDLKELLKQKTIDYYGRVENVSVYYKKAALALVPLQTGSGTRLKVLEAMGHGVPVLSTTIGAEGIDYKNGENIYLADDAASFASAIVQLLENRQLASHIAASAYALVKERYDWNVIGKSMEKFLNQD